MDVCPNAIAPGAGLSVVSDFESKQAESKLAGGASVAEQHHV